MMFHLILNKPEKDDWNKQKRKKEEKTYTNSHRHSICRLICNISDVNAMNEPKIQ